MGCVSSAPKTSDDKAVATASSSGSAPSASAASANAAAAPHSFLANMEWRRAYKTFGASSGPADVPAGIDKVVYAAQQAPSSFGTQPYKVVVVTNQEIKKQLRAAAWGQAQLEESTHVLVFCSMTAEAVAARGEEFIAKTGIPQGYADMVRGVHTADGAAAWAAKQAYIALSFALAAAAELKINSCPMEGFDPAAFAKILELPETLVPACILALGKEAADDAAARGYPRFRMPDLLIEKK